MMKSSIGVRFPDSKEKFNFFGRVAKGSNFLLFLFLNLFGLSVFATTISTNTTYTTPNTIPDDLVITNGAIVTVTGTTLSVNGNITVQPGCKLLITNNATLKIKENIYVQNGSIVSLGAILELTNNSTITAYGTAWGRIEIWGGTINRAKFIASNSKLEKAKCAVVNYKYNGTFGTDKNYLPVVSNLMERRGGILQLESVNFINNNYSIDFIENKDKSIFKYTIPSSSSTSKFINLNFDITNFPYPLNI